MSWESNIVLEGIFEFGAPLNVWRIQLESDRHSDRQHFYVWAQLDDNSYIETRLFQVWKAHCEWAYEGKGLKRFPRLIVMEKPISEWHEYVLYGPWLHGVATNSSYRPGQYPYENWNGLTLGIAFEKSKANQTAVNGFFHTLTEGATEYANDYRDH